MTYCPSCGHELGVGRFCTHCGQRVDGGPSSGPAPVPAGGRAGQPTSGQVSGPGDATAVRPPLSGVVPPAPGPPAPGPRYPLWADEVGAPTPGGSPAGPDGDPPQRQWLPWAAVAAALVLVAGLGTALLLGGSEDAADPAQTPSAGAPRSEATPGPSRGASRAPGESASPGADAAEPGNLARLAEASAPRTAPASTDTEGNMTRYVAANMLDEDPRTCWRARGDATGSELVFTFAEPVEITAVGLVNGYAKTDGVGARALDWYAGNRRVTAVTWTFDDGTTVPQDLREVRDLQSLQVDPVTTGSVRLRIVEVTEPGTGRARRDFTAVSDVALLGTPAP